MARRNGNGMSVFPPSESIHDTWFACGTGVEPQFLSTARSGRSPADHSHYYATGVFDGVGADCCVDGVYHIWAPQLHSERLVANAVTMGILDRPSPLSPGEVLTHSLETGSRNLRQLPQGARLYLRPDIFPLSTELGVGFPKPYGFSVVTRERTTYLKSDRPGVRVWYPGRVCRVNNLCGEPSVKSATNYGNVARFKNEGIARFNAPETLLETLEGVLAETTGSNLFVRIGDELFTPDEHSDILSGITRSFVIRIAHALDVRVNEVRLQPHRLKEASEVFLSGTWAGITPVEEILKGRESPEPIIGPFRDRAPGELTLKIATIYNALLVRNLDFVAQFAPRLDISESWWAEIPA